MSGGGTQKPRTHTHDSFNLSESYTSESLCMLCHCGEDMGKKLHAALHASSSDLMDSSSDEEGVENKSSKQFFEPDARRIWMSKNPIYVTTARHGFIHFYCALYAPLAWLHSGKEWLNVAQETRRSVHFTCAVCGLKGATLGCMNRKCNYSVHLPCAMEQGWSPSLVNKCSFQCPTHCSEDEDRRNELTQLELYDLSLGREAVEVSAQRAIFLDAMSLPYVYISKNVDSDDTQSNVIDIHAMHHCTCSGVSCGVSSDVNMDWDQAGDGCHCMQSGFQYSNKGPFKCLSPALMNNSCLSEGSPSPVLDVIYECGIRCRCSNRCANRVVGNGLQLQLQVQLKNVTSTISPIKSSRKGHRKSTVAADVFEEWSVVALEDIPVGAFVCEWTGQYVLGDSKPAVPGSVSLNRTAMGRGDRSTAVPVSVVSTLLIGGAGGRGCDNQGRIIPIHMWESTFPLLDVVGWGKAQTQQSKSPLSIKPAQSKDPALDNGAIKKKRLRARSDIDICIQGVGNNSDETSDSKFVEYMQSIVYVDSRYYSNVSRFINLTSQKTKSNLSRRCVSIDDDGNNLHPRLALFANQMIPAGTELVVY